MLDNLAVFDAENIDDRPAAILFVHFGLGFRCTQAHHGFMASFSSSGSMSSTATPPSAVFGRSAFGIGQPHRGRRGRMDIVRGRSVRSDAIAWTMSSCSASGIFAICCDRMRPITTRPGRTYHSTRMLRFRVAFTSPAGSYLSHSSVDFTTSTSELDFRQAQLSVRVVTFDGVALFQPAIGPDRSLNRVVAEQQLHGCIGGIPGRAISVRTR